MSFASISFLLFFFVMGIAISLEEENHKKFSLSFDNFESFARNFLFYFLFYIALFTKLQISIAPE